MVRCAINLAARSSKIQGHANSTGFKVFAPPPYASVREVNVATRTGSRVRRDLRGNCCGISDFGLREKDV